MNSSSITYQISPSWNATFIVKKINKKFERIQFIPGTSFCYIDDGVVMHSMRYFFRAFPFQFRLLQRLVLH